MNLTNGPINWLQLHDLSGNDTEFEQELLQIFIVDTQEQMAHLNQLVQASDWTGTQHAAHHIKGAAANVGAVVVSAAAARLEQGAREQQTTAVTTTLGELAVAVNELVQHLS